MINLNSKRKKKNARARKQKKYTLYVTQSSYAKAIPQRPSTNCFLRPDDMGRYRIARRPIIGRKKAGHITYKGRIHNIVVVPNPKPDAPDYDDIIPKPKKEIKSEG